MSDREEVAVERSKIRITPNGRINRRAAAVILGRSEKTLANWVRLKRGPAVIMVGHRAFYNYNEVVAYR